MRPANERRRYIVTSSLIDWAHIQKDPCSNTDMFLFINVWPASSLLYQIVPFHINFSTSGEQPEHRKLAQENQLPLV